MKKKCDLILINPPMATHRPDRYRVGTMFVPKNIRISCINTGVLSLATYLDSKGFKVTILDLYKYEDVTEASGALELFLLENEAAYYGISCSSGFSYLETLEIAQLIKRNDSRAVVITGGQHIGPLKDWPLKECSAIDVNVMYEGETILEHILGGGKLENLQGVARRNVGEVLVNFEYPSFVSLDDMPPLKFSLYPEYNKYTPYIEESRGCSSRCNFCISSFTNKGRIRVKSSRIFEKELESLISYFPDADMVAVLASSFGMNVQNTIEITESLRKHQIKWTTEIRVDSPWNQNNLLEKMVSSGLVILNVGAESLSSDILIRMNKTKNTERYIAQAQELIGACARHANLMLKFNIVMYQGETPKTFSDTLRILFANKDYFATVQFSPLFSFPGSRLYESLLGDGALCHDAFWDSIHMYPINLSPFYDAESAAVLCREMEKIFSDPEGYIKANSYKWHKTSRDEQEEIKKSSWR